MGARKIARRYAKALEIALDDDINRIEEVYLYLKQITSIFGIPKFAHVLNNRLIKSGLKEEVLLSLCSSIKSDLITKNFIRTVAAANRVHILPDVVFSLKEVILLKTGVRTATVKSAFPIGEQVLEELVQVLEKRFDSSITAEREVDESVIGGFVVRVGNSVCDLSLKTALERSIHSLGV